MNQLPPSSFFDLNEDHHDHHDHVDRDHLFNLNTQGEFFYTEPQQGFQFQPPLKADHKIVSSGGSCDHHNPRAEETESDNNDLKLSIWRNDSIDDDHRRHHEKKHTVTTHNNNYIDSSVKWTSSKMRMMRKMIITNPDQPHHNHDHNHSHNHVNPIIGCDHDDLHVPQNFLHRHHDLDHHRHRDHHQIMKNKHTPMTTSPLRADHSSSSSSNIINNINGTIRVCSDCNTTKTPLWRSGPRGPKSLCNACGIRQRKARRAMAAAAANGGVVATEANSSLKSPNSAKIIQHKEKKPKAANNPQFKKRCKLGAQPRGRKKLLCTFEDLRISISKNSAFNRVFPQDEKDAAILLMALSYGLVQG